MKDVLNKAYYLTKVYMDDDGFIYEPRYEDTLIEVYCDLCNISKELHGYLSTLWITHINYCPETKRIVEVNDILSKVDKLKEYFEKL